MRNQMDNLKLAIKDAEEIIKKHRSKNISKRNMIPYHEEKRKKIDRMITYWLNKCSDRKSNCERCKIKKDCTSAYDTINATFDRLSKHPIKEISR